MAHVELTKEVLDQLSTGKQQEEFYDRSFLAGGSFGVRVGGTRGSKVFFVIYPLNGRRRRMTLGRYPALSLERARELASEVVSAAHLGRDPAAEARLRQRADTIDDLASRFMAVHVERHCRPATQREYQRLLLREVLPVWGNRKAEDVTPKDVRLLVEHIALARGKPVLAARVRALVHKMFAEAMASRVLMSNPAAGLYFGQQSAHRLRVLTEAEISQFWAVLHSETPAMRAVLGLLLLTGQRLRDVLGLRWADIALDIWTVRNESTEQSWHEVHLVPAALEMLRDVRRQSGAQDFVFPSARGSGHLSYIRKAVSRVNAAMSGSEPWTAADLRRTVEAGLRRMRVRPDIIERVLGRRNVLVRLGLEKHDAVYRTEIKDALTRWAERAAPKPAVPPAPPSPGKVIPLFPSSDHRRR